jgi:hypothetical protein
MNLANIGCTRNRSAALIKIVAENRSMSEFRFGELFRPESFFLPTSFGCVGGSADIGSCDLPSAFVGNVAGSIYRRAI